MPVSEGFFKIIFNQHMMGLLSCGQVPIFSINHAWFYDVLMNSQYRIPILMQFFYMYIIVTLWKFFCLCSLLQVVLQQDSVTRLITDNSAVRLCAYHLSAFTIITNQNLPHWAHSRQSQFIFNFNYMRHWPFMVDNLKKDQSSLLANSFIS